MKTIATKDVLRKLDRIERLLLASLLHEGRVDSADLKTLGVSSRELNAARKAALGFDITQYVPGAQVGQWR